MISGARPKCGLERVPQFGPRFSADLLVEGRVSARTERNSSQNDEYDPEN